MEESSKSYKETPRYQGLSFCEKRKLDMNKTARSVYVQVLEMIVRDAQTGQGYKEKFSYAGEPDQERRLEVMAHNRGRLATKAQVLLVEGTELVERQHFQVISFSEYRRQVRAMLEVLPDLPFQGNSELQEQLREILPQVEAAYYASDFFEKYSAQAQGLNPKPNFSAKPE